MRPLLIVLLALVGSASGCGGDDPKPAAGEPKASKGARFPTVVNVKATAAQSSQAGAYDFAVTISSPYDSPERYADGWRVQTKAGKVLGEMKVGHDHATEQPFTRDQSDVAIPEGVGSVVVEGHDLENGYGGKTATVTLP